MQETQVQSLGWEDPLEKKMATHSSILAWEIPWTEETGGYSLWDDERLRHNLPIEKHQCKYGLTIFYFIYWVIISYSISSDPEIMFCAVRISF